ncbi:hypothetical protein BsWGS_00424 [Bradybaena similaris]
MAANKTTPDLRYDPNYKDEPSPTTKTKQRIKLWDSFLSKARKIRVKTKDKSQRNSKLEKRASSHPNIPSYTATNDFAYSSKETARLSKHSLEIASQEAGSNTIEYRSNRYIFHRGISRSATRLHDSPSQLYSRAAKENTSGVSFGSSQDIHDNENYSAYRNSVLTNETPDLSVGSFVSTGSQDIKSVKSQNLMNSSFDGDDDDVDGEDKDVSDDNHNLPQEPSVTSSAESEVQQYSMFTLNIHLQEGRDLVIRDACGTSDPYVKFIIANKVMYKSRIILKNLNPCWDERFSIPISDITKPLVLKVFDYDRAWSDDPMGGADLDLTAMVMNKETELKVMLTEKDNEEYMGFLLLTYTLIPKLEDNKELFFHRSTTRSTDSKKVRMQQWNGVVNIILVEGYNLVSMDDNGLSDPYVKFKLGMEKYKSKFKNKTLHPRWLEQFDLHLYEEQTTLLEIEVYDHDTRGKDDFMGRATIDLSTIERETTHIIEQQLEDGAGIIKLLLTVTGTIGQELTSDLTNYIPNAQVKDSIISKYGLLNSFTSLNDIGQLEVKVFRAHGLQAADFGGFSDPFCVLELINDRVQTHTEYKTLNPEWGKVFTFRVRDIHSVLEITVYDEDRNKKVEFLGKISIPLLKIRNYERRWYALKDIKMVHKAKGAILLEMNVIFNHIKAAIRTVNPREEKLIPPEEKFKIAVMKENINRVSRLIGVFMDTGKFIQSCFDWQSPPRTITAFVVYLVIVWSFELYMLPLSLLLVFMRNLLVAQIFSSVKKEPVEDDYVPDEDEDDDNYKDKQEEKKSIIDRYHAVQEVCLTVQKALDKVASLGERVKNTFNWSVPWLSTLAVIALLAGSIILFFIPLRVLLLIWGINKFTKKLRKPNAIPNNELLDFLSRVPSDNELVQYRELRPDIPANTPSKKKRS